MKGVYEAVVAISGLNSARTLMYITAPATRTIEILSAEVTNASNETNEQLECCLQTVGTLGTPTGTSLTPSKKEAGDQASAATVVGNVTASEPTYSSNTQIGRKGFPSLAGYLFDPIPEDRPYIAPSGTVGLRMLSTPTSFDATVKVSWREVG